jgi:hypothetical protein
VLPPDVGEDETAAFLAGTDAEKVQEINAKPELGLEREVTWHLGAGYYVHFAREAPSSVQFVQVSGSRLSEVNKIARILADKFAVVSDDGLLSSLDHARNPEDRRRLLVQAGIGAPNDIDERYFSRISDAMRDADPRVREGGLWAALYMEWLEFAPLVAEMVRSDSKQTLREQARVLLKHLERKARA